MSKPRGGLVNAACKQDPARHRERGVCFFPSENAKGKGSDILEMQVLEGEVGLYDAGGLHPGAQHVLLGGDVVSTGYPLQVIQVAGEGAERRCGSWTVGHDPSKSHGASLHCPRVPCPHPGIVRSAWAAPKPGSTADPICTLGSPRGLARHRQGRAGQPAAGTARRRRGTRARGAPCRHQGLGRGRSRGWGAPPCSPGRLHGGNGKRKVFSAMATGHSAGGNNRWRRAIYSQKTQRAGVLGGSGRRAAGGMGSSTARGAAAHAEPPRVASPALLSAPALPDPRSRQRRWLGPQSAAETGRGLPGRGEIKAGFDFSSSRCFNWVITNRLL